MAKDTSTTLALAEQEKELKLQAAKLAGATPTGLGKQLTAQAQQLQTPNVGSAVLKALALGMGGQQQRAEAQSSDEKNARMLQVIEQQIANTQQLRETKARATQKEAQKSYIADSAPAITSAIEMAISPNASPETIAQANNTVTNLVKSFGRDNGLQINSASIDPVNQLINIVSADGSTDQLTFPQIISTVGEKNPEFQKDMYARIYPDLAKTQAKSEGESAAVKTISETESLVKQLEASGNPLTEEQKRALNMGAKVNLTGDDVGLTKGATTSSQKDNLNQYQNSVKLLETINQVTKFVSNNPDAVGVKGQFRKYAGAMAGLIDPIQEQFKDDVTNGLVDPDVIKKMNSVGADTTALDTLQTLLAYQLAKSQDPGGKISDADYKAAVSAVNLTGVTARPETIEAQLKILEERAQSLVGTTQKFLDNPVNPQSPQISKEVQDLLEKYRR